MLNSRELLDKLNRMRLQKDYNLISMPEIQLTPKEADEFIDCMADQSVMKNYARIHRMSRPQEYMRKIGFGDERFLYPAGHFDESRYKKQRVQDRVRLDTEELRGAIVIFDSDVDDLSFMYSEAQFTNKLMEMVAKQVANELEEIGYMGDTAGLNSFPAWDARGVLNGWRYIINHSQTGQAYYSDVCGAAHIKEACMCESGASCPSGQSDPDGVFQFPGKIAVQDTNPPYNWEYKYHKMIKNMPSKYKAKYGINNMVFLNSDLVTQDYIEALSARATALGDAIFTGQAPAAYGKVPIIDVPLMPTNLGQDADATFGLLGGGEYTDVIFTPKQNLIIGIQRDIRIERWRVPPDQANYIFYSIRVCFNIENVNAIVFMRCLEHAC